MLLRALELPCLLPHAKASQIPFCLLALSHPSHGWCRLCTNIKHPVKRILVPSTRTPHCMLRHVILLRAQHPSSSCQRKTKSHVLRCSLLVRVPGSAVRRGEMRTKRWMLLWWTEGRRLAGFIWMSRTSERSGKMQRLDTGSSREV